MSNEDKMRQRQKQLEMEKRENNRIKNMMSYDSMVQEHHDRVNQLFIKK